MCSTNIEWPILNFFLQAVKSECLIFSCCCHAVFVCFIPQILFLKTYFYLHCSKLLYKWKKISHFRNCMHTISRLLIKFKRSNFLKYYILLLAEIRLIILDISTFLMHCLDALLKLKLDHGPVIFWVCRCNGKKIVLQSVLSKLTSLFLVYSLA